MHVQKYLYSKFFVIFKKDINYKVMTSLKIDIIQTLFYFWFLCSLFCGNDSHNYHFKKTIYIK